MVKINYAELRFDHIVEFTQEQTIFVCCKENGCGRTRLFLIFEDGNGSVYTRNGRADSWEVLTGEDAETIRQQIRQANGIPTYQLNGSSRAIAGHNIPA